MSLTISKTGLRIYGSDYEPPTVFVLLSFSVPITMDKMTVTLHPFKSLAVQQAFQEQVALSEQLPTFTALSSDINPVQAHVLAKAYLEDLGFTVIIN